MSMSLRDQLLAAGLVSQKQVRDAERHEQHQQREQAKHQRRPPASKGQAGKAPGHGATGANANPARTPVAGANGGRAGAGAPHAAGAGAGATSAALPSAALRHASAQSAKVARDLALNKKQQEKAAQRARAAQIKQLIEQNRVPRGESDERFNFVEGGRVKFIGVNADIRRRLLAGELMIVRHERIYEVVPTAIAQRIGERDARAVISAAAASAEVPPVDDAYKDFAVPDDLMW